VQQQPELQSAAAEHAEPDAVAAEPAEPIPEPAAVFAVLGAASPSSAPSFGAVFAVFGAVFAVFGAVLGARPELAERFAAAGRRLRGARSTVEL
jgi:hypothetical protein